MRIATLVSCLLSVLPVVASAADSFICRDSSQELHQLRIYEINRNNREAFHKRFQDHALPITNRYGFRIIDMWESDTGEKLEFVYILTWPDEATMELRWKEFLADQEWIAIKKQTATEIGILVREILSSQSMIRVSYSPSCHSK